MADARNNRQRKARARKRMKVWRARRAAVIKANRRRDNSFYTWVIDLLNAKWVKDIQDIEDAYFLAEIERQLSA